MIDLTFLAVRTRGAGWLQFPNQPDTWVWQPAWPTFPNTPETSEAMALANWVKAGSYRDQRLSFWIHSSQLSDIRLLEAQDEQGQPDNHIWTPFTQLEALPVLLAFTPSSEQRRRSRALSARSFVAPDTLPPANLGEIGLILTPEGEGVDCKRYPITRLPNECQTLRRRLGAAATWLASARNLDGAAWLEQWREIQAMTRQLAAAYWRAHQDQQVERPQPINIWKIHQSGQASALAPLTMIHDGAHAAIYHKDDTTRWKREHMIEDGKLQGLRVPRYIHTHGKKGENSTEYWMQPAPGEDIPDDPELVSQELMRYQAKLDDLNCDLSMLAPIYLLAVQQEEVYISPDQLLKDLGFTPHRNQAGYGNTHEPGEVQRIKNAFENMARFHLKTRQWVQKRRGVKPHLVTAEAPYLVITERIYQEPLEEGGPRKFLGWKYRIPWLETFTSGDTDAGRQLGQLLKRSFTYKQDHQRWEKRLARYLTIHLNVAAHHGQASINRIIRNVLEQCSLAPTERDKARPGEYANQFEKAMNLLQADHIIGDWMPVLDRHAPDFPTRNWLDLWLDSSFRVTQAQTALDAGYQKMIDARKPHKAPEGA